MKIALLLFNMPLSKLCGSARYTVQVASKLTEQGHDVTVIANKDSDNKRYNFQHIQVDTPPYGSWGNCLTDPSSFLNTIFEYTQTLVSLHKYLAIMNYLQVIIVYSLWNRLLLFLRGLV